jgi:hypothetical protein
MGTSDSLMDYARSFAEHKQPLLNTIPPSAAISIACWLSDMITSAQENDVARVHRIATRINDMLSDEMTWQQYHHHHCSCMDADHV